MEKVNWKELEIGALWNSRNASSNVKFTGKIKVEGKEVQVVIMANNFKKPDDNSPDYRVYIAPPRDGSSAPAKAPTAADKPKPAAKSPQAPPAPPTENVDVPW